MPAVLQNYDCLAKNLIYLTRLLAKIFGNFSTKNVNRVKLSERNDKIEFSKENFLKNHLELKLRDL